LAWRELARWDLSFPRWQGVDIWMHLVTRVLGTIDLCTTWWLDWAWRYLLIQVFCCVEILEGISQGVYQISYSCDKSYIDQTSKSIQTHLKKHIIDTFHNYITKSTIMIIHITQRTSLALIKPKFGICTLLLITNY
jgi:hypothetical protein